MKKTLLVFAMMLFGLSAMAKPVDQATAARVATNFWNAHREAGVAALTAPMKQVSLPFDGMYLFTAPEGGFVLVAADDCVTPILGYSFYNSAPEFKESSENARYIQVREWFSAYQEQIELIRENNIEATSEITKQWSLYSAASQGDPTPLTAISPLLSTTWDQAPYYNNLCPYDANESAYYNNRVVTGCVATATAQVMKYHNHPATGYGSHSYYEDNYGMQTANFGATSYNWSNMPTALSSVSSSTQVNAIATLMYHVGVSVEMDYDLAANGGSGAQNYNFFGDISESSESSLQRYFKYRPDMALLWSDDYSESQYRALLQAELNQSRPILYSGKNTSGGHSFVCDGYNTAGQFHFNWGWGGSYNGYFTLGSLNPGVGGIGGNSSGTYNMSNAALIGIRPNTSWSTTGSTIISTTNVNGGTVSGTGTYSFGDTITLVATANTGYRFDGWSDGSKFNPRQLLATGGSYNFTPVFTSITSDTVTYCTGNRYLYPYGNPAGGTHWGIKIPSTSLPNGESLNAVQVFIADAGTYTMNIYTGASPSSSVASRTVTFTSNDEGDWQTIYLNTPVNTTEDLWIVFYCSDVPFPVAVTYYSGAENSFLFSSMGLSWLDDYSASFQSAAMIKAIFGSGSTPSNCVISSFPYNEGFEDYNTLDCWSLYDADGDGENWFLFGQPDSMFAHNSDNGIVSASWQSVALTPDNWLFTPGFALPANQQMHLKWYAKGQDPSWAAEYCSVYVSTSGNTVTDFSTTSPVYSGYSTANWVQHDVDLSAYAGQTIYVAFRHYNVTDMFRLMIDDIEISSSSAPQPTTYTITVQSANPTMGTVSGSGTYPVGTSVTISATANSGYHFTQWNDGNTNATRNITVTGDVIYIASFEADAGCPPVTTFPYAENFDGTFGCWTAIDGNNDGHTWQIASGINGSSSTIIPHSGSGMASSFSWNADPMYANEYLVSPQFTLPAGQIITLSWWFCVNGSYPEDKLAVKVSTAGNSVTNFTTTVFDVTPTAANGSWTQQTVDLSAYAGQSIYLAFHHHDSYDANYLLVDDIQITASSSQSTQYTITVQSANPTMGTVTGGGTYNEGTTVTLTATPANGYHFTQWNDGNTNATRTITVTADATYIANFEINAPNQYTITVQSANPTMGTVSGGGTYNAGTNVTISATANSGYHFTQWNDGNTNATRTITVTGNATYIASFEADAPAQYTITVQSANPTMGSVSGGGTYNAGTSVTISAMANSGYHFTQWNDGNTNATRTVIVTGNATYIASFEADVNPQDPCIVNTFPYLENFENSENLGCWVINDVDGDGFNWLYFSDGSSSYGHSGLAALGSASWDQTAGPLTPDNWLITPGFALPANQQLYLKWYEKGQDVNDFAENYSVYVSTTGDAITDFTTVVYSGTTVNSWQQQSVNLSAYAGQTIYVAFRHHNTTNMYYLLIDDVEISAGAPLPTQYTLTVLSNNDNWGNVTGGGTYPAGSTATIKALPYSGYHFVQWQDGNTNATRTVTVNADATYIATFAQNTGIGDVDGSSLALYPNPATDKVTLVGVEQADVTVTDITGRTVLVQKIVDGHNTIEVGTLLSGTYFVRISYNGDTVVRKLIIK